MTDIMFVSRQRITGSTNGSSAYLLDLARATRAAGCVPHLIHPSPTMMGRTPIARLSKDLGVFETHRARGIVKVGRTMISLALPTYLAAARGVFAKILRRSGYEGRWSTDRPQPYSVSIPWTRADHRFVRQHLKGRCDILIADYIFQVEAFDDAPQGMPTALVMHDLFHRRDTASEANAGRDRVANIDAATEAAMIGRAKTVIAIQQDEESWVKENAPDVQSVLFPMSYDTVDRPQTGNNNVALFVGSHTAPNIVGLEWFLSKAWPIVRARRPDAHLVVAGSVYRAFSGRVFEGVKFAGFVQDLTTHYRDAAIVISPLTFGSGLKVKLIEALAAGKAVVATSVTLQGVHAQCEGAVAVADDATAFAEAIVNLASDDGERLRLATSALEAAKRHFGQSECGAEYMKWLRRLDTENRQGQT